MKSLITTTGLFILLQSLSFAVKAQDGGENVISSSGDTYSASQVTVSFTLGQLMIETYKGSEVVVTHGFHQSLKDMVLAIEKADVQLRVNAYPNPTRDHLTITTEGDQIIKYSLFNLMGIRVSQGRFQRQMVLNVAMYAMGSYQLILTDKNDQLIKTFEIQFK